jgi:hypothetical protein
MNNSKSFRQISKRKSNRKSNRKYNRKSNRKSNRKYKRKSKKKSKKKSNSKNKMRGGAAQGKIMVWDPRKWTKRGDNAYGNSIYIKNGNPKMYEVLYSGILSKGDKVKVLQRSSEVYGTLELIEKARDLQEETQDSEFICTLKFDMMEGDRTGTRFEHEHKGKTYPVEIPDTHGGRSFYVDLYIDGSTESYPA